MNADILAQFREQYATAEALYLRKSKHLEYLQESVNNALSADNAQVEGFEGGCRQFLPSGIMSQILRTYHRLVLFSRINKKAATRVLNKIKRRAGLDHELVGLTAAFFNLSASIHMASWAEGLLKPSSADCHVSSKLLARYRTTFVDLMVFEPSVPQLTMLGRSNSTTESMLSLAVACWPLPN
jgi:hypothetical protein